MLVVRPETVIAWHAQGFKMLWRRRSRRGKFFAVVPVFVIMEIGSRRSSPPDISDHEVPLEGHNALRSA